MNDDLTLEIPKFYVNVDVFLNDDGRIIRWRQAKEGGYKLDENELLRFSNCSGNCYRIDGEFLVYDETLPPIIVEKQPTEIEILGQITTDLELMILEVKNNV